MGPRLKVFEWSDGFHRFTVAASSRPKALAAWGIRQDIFASGLAREAPDPEDGAAARAHPEVVIERGLAVDIGVAGPRRAPVKVRKGPTEAQRCRVEVLTDRLAALEREGAGRAERFRAEMARLQTQADGEKSRFETEKAQLAQDLAKARGKL